MQVPDAFLRAVVGFELPAAGAYAVGIAFLPRDEAERRRGRGHDRGDRRRGGPRGPRLARRADRPDSPRSRPRPRRDADVRAAVRRRARASRVSGIALDRAGVLPAQARRARGRRLLPVAVVPHPGLQGHADHRAARAASSPTSSTSAWRRALAVVHSPVLDQHVPELAARAPVPLHRAQRRDQHRQGQPQLDAGPRGAADERPASPATSSRLFPICTPDALRLRVLRRGARAAAPRRPLAAARGADDDPRGVGEPRPTWTRRAGRSTSSTPA